MNQSKSTIIYLGEILWDLLPTGKLAGGAPMNIAFHANQLGIAAKMISKVGKAADAFVFGSLTARNEATKNTLLELLKLANLKAFDVNLRSPFLTKSLLMELLQQVDIVKMNDNELEIIGRWLEIDDTEEKTALKIKSTSIGNS